MLDDVDNLSIIDIDDTLNFPDADPRDCRIHNWLSEQCRFALSDPAPAASNNHASRSNLFLSVPIDAPAMRADSPLLGFENASHDPLHFPSPTYVRDLPQRETQVDHDHADPVLPIDDLVPVIPLEKREKPLPAPPTLNVTQIDAGGSSVISLPPSFTRLPFHPRPKTQSPGHSPSSSVHSRTSQNTHTHTRSPSNLSQSSGSLSRSGSQNYPSRPSVARQPSLPLLGETSVLASPPSLVPAQDAVPISSRSRSQSTASLYHLPSSHIVPLSPLSTSPGFTRRQSTQSRYLSISSTLSQASLLTPESTSVRNAVYIDSEEVKDRLDGLLLAASISTQTLNQDDEDTVEYEHDYEADGVSTELFYVPAPSAQATRGGVPPNTPISAYYQTPYASSSQVYLGTPASTSLSVLQEAAPIRPAPAPVLVLDSSSEEGSPMFEGSTSTPGTSPAPSSLGKGPYGGCYSDGPDQIGGLHPPSMSRWSLTSSTGDPEGETQKSGAQKGGKRKRLVSFISRLSNAPWESIPPTPTSTNGSLSVTPTLTTPFDSIPPTPTHEPGEHDWDVPQYKQSLNIVTALLDRDVNATEATNSRRSVSNPGSPVSPKTSQENGRQRLKNMSSLGSISAVAKSQGGNSMFRNLAARFGLANEEADWGTMSVLKVPKNGKKRKLLISGVNSGDAKAYEAVKAWCENFGELRQISHKSNGTLQVEFKKATVAETVCRLQARVHIKGAGSVGISWTTKKGTV